MNEVYVLPKWTFGADVARITDGKTYMIIDTTSGSGPFRELSPFILGPCATDQPETYAQNFENFYQGTKVYKGQTRITDSDTLDEVPSEAWIKFRNSLWENHRAIRYPMGKGAKPLFAWWYGRKLNYIQARKEIYARGYFVNVIHTSAYKRLHELFKGNNLVLLDYDAYNHRALGMTLKDVIHDPTRKCGHAFVLAMILTGVLADCIDRHPYESPKIYDPEPQ